MERAPLASTEDDCGEGLDPKTVASWALESDAECVDELLELSELLGMTLGRAAAVAALRAPRRAAVADAGPEEEAVVAPFVDHRLGSLAAGPQEAAVDDGALEAGQELPARRKSLPDHGAEGDVDDVLEEEVTEVPHLLRHRWMSMRA